MNKKKASATLVVIILGIVFLIYAFSTYSDILHLENMYDEYEENTKELFEKIYRNQENLL